MNNFETVIGIEIHIELNTKTKMFSAASNDFNAEHNTNASVIDLAYPGTLPQLNKGAVERAIKLAKALNMSIDSELHFDRKHYFYQDLPKGYQITQQARPVARNGKLPISNKDIAIDFFHLEEDTAKTINEDSKVLLNYNRAGVPLIEIVTAPVIRSAKEATEYIDGIRTLVSSLGISDAKMEEGSLRADINISLRPYGQEAFGTKVEIKNLNSLSNVEKGIKDVENKIAKMLLKGEAVQQATMRFDESKQEAVVMRVKTGAADYKFFPEPNIPVIALDKAWVDSIKISELPWEQKSRYIKENLEAEFVDKLMSDLERASYFDSIPYKNKVTLAKVFFAEVVQIANNQNKTVKDLNIDPEQLAIALTRQDEGIISGKHIKELIPLLVGSSMKTDEIIEARKMKQLSDVNELSQIIGKIINDNKSFIIENKERPERVAKNLLGLLMKQTGGQANPVVSNQILEKLLMEV